MEWHSPYRAPLGVDFVAPGTVEYLVKTCSRSGFSCPCEGGLRLEICHLHGENISSFHAGILVFRHVITTIGHLTRRPCVRYPRTSDGKDLPDRTN